ncbi:Ubiquitin-like protein 4A [Acipenser ruthenus]|uniref:Ubiquitin-like protein 4A n=1 Tax=Acipenser ruthenus TaxID=7906 RepID=A0A444V389_ACIRT|nr:Ubiquitin-like protein 4A [Acipenser ruthenus]
MELKGRSYYPVVVPAAVAVLCATGAPAAALAGKMDTACSCDSVSLPLPLSQDYERRLCLLSLDDMERLATRMLHPEAGECMELSFLD